MQPELLGWLTWGRWFLAGDTIKLCGINNKCGWFGLVWFLVLVRACVNDTTRAVRRATTEGGRGLSGEVGMENPCFGCLPAIPFRV